MPRLLVNNTCRLFAADPIYSSESHFAHHRSLGTPEDGSFTNFVRLRRLLGALAPMAPVLSVSDYFPWRPQEHTRSRNPSAVLTILYMTTLGVLAYWRFGATYTLVALLLVGTWVSYALDRVRESVEHLYMPLEREDGTRELGLGFWGLLLGGGPWGQPCHLSHHLPTGCCACWKKEGPCPRKTQWAPTLGPAQLAGCCTPSRRTAPAAHFPAASFRMARLGRRVPPRGCTASPPARSSAPAAPLSGTPWPLCTSPPPSTGLPFPLCVDPLGKANWLTHGE